MWVGIWGIRSIQEIFVDPLYRVLCSNVLAYLTSFCELLFAFFFASLHKVTGVIEALMFAISCE